MTQKERDLLYRRLIVCRAKYDGDEPTRIKRKLDSTFCKRFTVNPLHNPEYVVELLVDSILEKNENDVDLILCLCEHFQLTPYIDEVIAPLLVQPWHHFHERIAGILEFDKNEKTVDWLFRGATYHCDHLDYQSDYCGFQKKCLFALLNIGNERAIRCIKEIAACSHFIVAGYANEIIQKHQL